MVFVETINIVGGQVVQRCPVNVVVSHLRQKCVGGTTGGTKGGQWETDDNNNGTAKRIMEGTKKKSRVGA